ncbi:MAG: penicillin acylase family protein [Chitinophagales bacterium]
MRKIRFLFTFLLTLCLIVLLSRSWSGKPAMGAFLSPFTGFWQNAESTTLHLDTDIATENLQDSAHVYFDELRVPHIFANNEHDLYYLQGYVIASLRLWQMEFQVMAAEGRISELIGENAIQFDIDQRRKGLPFGAENKLKVIEEDPFAKELIGAYTDGINAYIESLSPRDLPLEYKLMGYEPEPWSAYKTALLLMNMADVLTSREYDIEYSNFATKYGDELFNDLYHRYDDNVEPVIQEPGEGWEKALGMDTTEGYDVDSVLQILFSENKELSPILDKPSRTIGSNNWALSGKKTASGYPLLANDPHLKLTFPSIWIEMHMHGPNSNTYGVTFTGSPGIVIGFNDYIGWGVTNAGSDVKDWYTIEFKDETKEFYKWEDGWRESEIVIEEIKVKGTASIYDTIVYTHLGPVTLENYETQQGTVNLALQWMAYESSQEYRTFYLLNRAKNFEEYLEALEYYSCPAQNFVFAAVDGDIALRQQGKLPVLDENEGLFVEDGSTMEAWDEFIPFEHIPMEYNPIKGFVSSANQHAVNEDYPYYTNGVFESYRNRVINSEIRAMHKADVDEMKQLQFNDFNLKAAESLPVMLSYISTFDMTFEEQEIYEVLKNWDYHNKAESEVATYYEIFFGQYRTQLWDELAGEGFIAPDDFQTIRLLRDSVSHPLIDNQNTTAIESTRENLQIAFDNMITIVDTLESTEWSEYRGTHVKHLARIDAFSTFLDVDGTADAPNAIGPLAGPSWRMILDFDNEEVTGYGVYPGGQSGNPGSPYYDNFVEDWSQAVYHDLNNTGDQEKFETEDFEKVTFTPKN